MTDPGGASWDVAKEIKNTLFRAFIRAPRARRVLEDHLVENFGREGNDYIGHAQWAVAITAEVLVVWDLARVDGPFTIVHREFLMKPWMTVFGPQ